MKGLREIKRGTEAGKRNIRRGWLGVWVWVCLLFLYFFCTDVKSIVASRLHVPNGLKSKERENE